MSNPKQRRNLFPYYILLCLVVTMSAIIVFLITVVAPIVDEEIESSSTTVMLLEAPLYDKNDFPGSSFALVDWCFSSGEEHILTRISQDNASIECESPGTTFFTSEEPPTLECYERGADDWAISSCNGNRPYAGSLAQAMEWCGKSHLIHMANIKWALCTDDYYLMITRVLPGSVLECYNLSQESAGLEPCPQELLDSANSTIPEPPYFDTTTIPPPNTLPAGVPVCADEIIVVDEMTGEDYCTWRGGSIPLPPNQMFELTCYDAVTREQIMCPGTFVPDVPPASPTETPTTVF